MTVRNLTAGNVRLQITGGRQMLDVPTNVCYQVLVDVDGPIHIQ